MEQILTMASDEERPVVDLKDGKMMLVKVEACSISAGDAIMISGACDKVRARLDPFLYNKAVLVLI